MVFQISVIQIAIIVFAIFALSRVFINYRGSKSSFFEFVFWTLVWIGIIVFALIPQFSDLISKNLGIAKGVDLLAYTSIVLLFYLIYRMYIRIDAMGRQMTSLVRTLALQKAKPAKKKTAKKR